MKTIAIGIISNGVRGQEEFIELYQDKKRREKSRTVSREYWEKFQRECGNDPEQVLNEHHQERDAWIGEILSSQN